jgi:hypothetical protein
MGASPTSDGSALFEPERGGRGPSFEVEAGGVVMMVSLSRSRCDLDSSTSASSPTSSLASTPH